MFYRPEFCCSCGEKIERTEWKPWTSRRFCQLCATEHQVSELLPKILVVLASLIGIVGFTNYVQTPPTSGPLVTKHALSVKPNEQPRSPNFQTTETGTNQSQPSSRLTNANVSSPVAVNGKTKTDRAADKTEAIYYCGAETKKGTPCTRKVKGNIRCWQHKGMPAILPPTKLLVSN